jgi:hypothetical protein
LVQLARALSPYRQSVEVETTIGKAPPSGFRIFSSQPTSRQIAIVPLFTRYLGIDYSGAETIDSPLPGLRVYSATPTTDPLEVRPPKVRQKHWTRKTLAHWLADELLDNPATLVGVDHAFSFPLQYFKTHRLTQSWEDLLQDFEAHWPTRKPRITVDLIREGVCGRGAERSGNSRWRRLCDVRCRGKSVFHFDVPGSVAKATHAGLPWLQYLRERLGRDLHFWPFDRWIPPEDRSVIAEVYPTLWKNAYPAEDRDPHQHDAYSVARWMREADTDDQLVRALHPRLTPDEKNTARVEGWILGLAAASEDEPPQKAKSPRSRKAAGKGRKPSPFPKRARTSRARERIHEIADKFHGMLVTPRQVFFLQAAIGSLDDTLDDREVVSLLEAMPPDFSDIPRDELRLIEIDRNFKITTHPPPPFPHDPAAYCRLHPRR